MGKLLVTAPTAGWTGQSAGVNFVDGEALVIDPAEHPDHPKADLVRAALQYFQRRGYAIGPEPGQEQEPGPDVPEPGPAEKPGPAATKAELADYAISHGLDPSSAKTKADISDLIDAHLKDAS